MEVVHSIVTDVADLKDTSRFNLPPLYDTLDPDALENFVSSSDDTVTLEFEYCDCMVRIETDGGIEISETEST